MPKEDYMTAYCKTEHTNLRDIQLKDVHNIVKWKNDPLIRKMSVGLDTIINDENQERDIKRSIDNDDELYFIIYLNSTGKEIGYIRINWLDDTKKFAWLRFGLGEERGHGYAKEALNGLIQKLLKEGLHRIDAEVYDYNKRSFHLLTSLNFTKEGIKRQAHFENNEYSDVYVLGFLKDDK